MRRYCNSVNTALFMNISTIVLASRGDFGGGGSLAASGLFSPKDLGDLKKMVKQASRCPQMTRW